MQFKCKTDRSIVILQQDQLYLETINSTDTLECNIQAKEMSNEIYLEITSKYGKGRVLIMFEELVPETFCIALIFIHTLIILLLIAWVTFFCMKVYHCFVQRYECKRKEMVLFAFVSLILMCLVLLTLIYCYISITRISFLIGIWLVAVGLIILLLVVFLYQENEHTKRKCKECLKKLAAEQHLKEIHI